MNPIPYLDLKIQHTTIAGEIRASLDDVCASGMFAQGPVTGEFEREFAAYCGAAHCVTVNSGTDALHLALRCLDIGPGDEVITTPFTFIATAWAISYVGAKPVFVDIDAQRRTLDPQLLEAAITPRTKAIMPVHIFGMPADMDPILAIADQRGIPVVEDAAQAHGARYYSHKTADSRPQPADRGPTANAGPEKSPVSSLPSPVWRRCGSMGAMSCFSFYPTKNLGAYGEGGALVTDDDRTATRARSLRAHAQSKPYVHEEIGYNYRMDSFQAAVLRVKLKRLDDWNAARRSHAQRYNELLAGSLVTRPSTLDDSECVWHCYVIESDDRDRVRDALTKAGIGTALNYPVPLHLQPVYRSLGYRLGDLPVAERLSQRCLSLPIYPELTDNQIETVATALQKAL